MKLLKNFSSSPAGLKCKIALCTAMVYFSSGYVYGQTSQTSDTYGSQVITKSSQALYGLLESVANLLRVILGIGALVTLVMVIFNIFKGEREAASKIAWWVAGLTLGFVLITVVKGIIPSGGAGGI